MVCENCIKNISEKITYEDILLLKVLRKHDADSYLNTLSKEEILNNSQLTISKLNNSIIKLEFVKLIDRNPHAKPQRFLITDKGKLILKLKGE